MTDKLRDDPSPIVTPPAKEEILSATKTDVDKATSTTVRHLTVSADEAGLRFDAVGIYRLRVLITEEEPEIWVAQGLEIDYVAQGRSIPEVKQRFQDGLRATITEQLKQFGNIRQLLVPARDEVLLEFESAIQGPVLYSQISFHVEPIKDGLPINYFSETKAA